MKKKFDVKKIALYGMLVALAFTFSYFETLIPVNFGIPGVKLGLANLVVVVALYVLSPVQAFSVAIIRVLLAALTFGNAYSLAYSLCGSILSFAVMYFAKKTKLSIVGVSILGGVCHNIGQLIVAIVVMGTSRIAYYLPVLLVSGMLTGLLIGIASKLIADRIKSAVKAENNS